LNTKFRVSSERLGKVTAFNKAVYETPCDTLLFLDSDVEIRQEGFVRQVVDELSSF
jgi:hypothetical protein